MKKRLLGLVLLLALVFSLVPTSAFARTDVQVVPDYYYDYDWGWKDLYVEVYDADGYKVERTGWNRFTLYEGDYTAKVYYGYDKDYVYTETFYYDGNKSTVYLDRYYGRPDRWPYEDYYYLSSIRVYKDRVTGYAAPYADVVLYDGSGSLKTATASRDGSFTIYYDFAYYYDYKDYGYWYDLDNFYLRSNGGSKYYLKSAYVDGYYYDRDLYTEPMAGDDFIKGSWAYGYGDIVVRDYQDNYLGSGSPKTDGSFYISLNRKLRAGESLRITRLYGNNFDKTQTVVVGGIDKVEKTVSTFVIGDPTYTKSVDGYKTVETMDVAPYIDNGRTMLPLRYVAQSLGFSVTWDEATKNAVFIKGNDTAVVNLYSREIFVNGKSHMLSVQPITVNGRIMLPVSEIGMALGLTHGDYGQGKNIEWSGSTNTVYITIYE